MPNNLDDVIRNDCQSGLKFQTAEELHRAVMIYNAIDPVVPKESLARITGEVIDTGSWTYCMGRTAIRAERKQDGMCYLSIRDKLLPHRSEIMLGQQVGASIGYDHCEVSRIWAAEKQRFSIPLSDIETIYTALNQKFNPQIFAETFLTPWRFDQDPEQIVRFVSPITFSVGDAVEARLGISRPRTISPEETKDKARDYQYRLEQNSLTGPARLDPAGRFVPIDMCLTLRSINAPIHDKNLERHIRILGDKAENAWLTPALAAKRAAKGQHERRFRLELS